MAPNKYRELHPLERIEEGDEFTWKHHHDDTEEDWYPCESFIGRTPASIQRVSNVLFRRPL